MVIKVSSTFIFSYHLKKKLTSFSKNVLITFCMTSDNPSVNIINKCNNENSYKS